MARPVAAWSLKEPDREQLVVSRTFGRDVGDPEGVYKALATFGTVACEKMRGRGPLSPDGQAIPGVFAS